MTRQILRACIQVLDRNAHQRHRHGEQHFLLCETEQQMSQAQVLAVRVHLEGVL
jgi:hypothetical protein